jgi:hypothetical protein
LSLCVMGRSVLTGRTPVKPSPCSQKYRGIFRCFVSVSIALDYW